MLMDCSGFETLMAFWMKGHVLNREVVHLKVSGWLSDFTVFLTSALAMFLSGLKDARDGSENIWLVSGCFKNMTIYTLSLLYIRGDTIALGRGEEGKS